MPNQLVEQKLAALQGWVTAGLTFIVVVAVTMTGVMLWLAVQSGRQSAEIEAVAISTKTALCAFKRDLQVRSDGLDAFIEEHPTGIPGISRAVLEQSRRNYAATLASLDGLACP